MRRLLHAFILVLTLIVGATAAAVIVTQTAWFKNWLRAYIVREANQYLNGTVSIDRLGGNLFFGLEMENVGVSMDGSQVVAVKDLGLDYNAFELLSKGLSVDNIRLNQPVIYLRREGDTWSLSRLVKKQQQESDRQGPDRPISIEDIGVSDGAIVIDGPVGTSGVEVPKRFDHLDARLAFKYEPVRYSIEITHVSFRGSDPDLALNALSGGVSVRNDTVYVEKLALRTAESSVSVEGAVQQYLTRPIFNLQVTSDKLSLPELARLVPALDRVRLQPAFEVRVSGPLDHLGVDLNVRSSAGQAVGKLVADVETPGQSASGTLSVRHLNLAPILGDPHQKSDVTADAKFDLRAKTFSETGSLRGSASINAPRIAAAGFVAERIAANAKIAGRRVDVTGRASAYGALVSTAGAVTLSANGHDPVAFDLRGRAQHVNLARLPREANAPAAVSDLNASYRASGTPADLTADVRFEPSTVAGVAIADGSTAGASLHGKALAYRADATVSGVDLQRAGREFNVPSLASDRYKSAINGHLVVDGRGTTPQEMNLTANGTLNDTTILGGRIPALTFDAALADDTVRLKANGSFEGFDPAALSGESRAQGSVAGTADVDATVRDLSRGVTVDSVEATARATLQPSHVAGLEITRANIDADYHDSTADIRTLDVAGRDLNATAQGTIALNDTGTSNLTAHVDSPSLAEIGTLVGQPLTGIARIDATITGNKSELQAHGTFTGDGIKYEDNGALTIVSDYTARVPDLRLEDATVTANTRGTFVTVGGQNVNELTAKTEYRQKQVTFDATAKQPQRSLQAAGSLLLHPDHQEVHLTGLSLQTAGQTWRLEPGASATIQYGGDAVAVENLAIVSGTQRVDASGRFGDQDDTLRVTLKDVDLAGVDALLLRPPQFSGRVNATATVSGTKAAPRITADFSVAQGGFRQFRYDTLGGTVDYGGKGITLDARLDQNPTTWVTAKGYVPMAAFASRPDASRPHHEPGAPDDRFDVHVDSSPIDLGIVQGFTTALTNVTGTAQAKVDVTGAADDPHPSGFVTVQNAAFTVDPTGVGYHGVEGRVEFQSDKVHIADIEALDNHDASLSLTGDLAVHGGEVGGVAIDVTAEDFKVIDNKMGNVRVNSSVRLTGELRQPTVEGYLGVSTGVINLDEIISRVGDSAYATKQTEYVSRAEDSQGQTTPPSAFEALRMDLQLTVPNDLVIKGQDLQTPGSPVGLGALNLTLGGDVRLTKAQGGQPKLVGIVNTVRGTYDFQGRRFDILRDGTIRFEGDTLSDFNPALDIRTQRLIRAVTANVNIRGQLKMPEIVLSSTPPLEQADIMALIIFNQPINELGEGQQASVAQRAEQIAAGAVAGQLAQSIGRALNLQTFEISTATDNGNAAQLTVGQQVGQNLYVKVQQGVGEQSQTNVILEYELEKWLRLRTNVFQGSNTQQQLFQRVQDSGADLLFFFSF